MSLLQATVIFVSEIRGQVVHRAPADRPLTSPVDSDGVDLRGWQESAARTRVDVWLWSGS